MTNFSGRSWRAPKRWTCPIYVHPTPPPQAVIDASYGRFPQPVTEMLAGAGWGWHIETAVHVIRMILGGVFDAFPKLQIVVGHMGEALPFMLPRLDNISDVSDEAKTSR